MVRCRVCEHLKIEAINAALDGKRAPNLVRAQFRLDPQMFAVHLAHRAVVDKGQVPMVQEDEPRQHWSEGHLRAVAPMGDSGRSGGIEDDALRYFQQAWRLARGDPRLQARMVAWLNEQLQAEEMGL